MSMVQFVLGMIFALSCLVYGVSEIIKDIRNDSVKYQKKRLDKERDAAFRKLNEAAFTAENEMLRVAMSEKSAK